VNERLELRTFLLNEVSVNTPTTPTQIKAKPKLGGELQGHKFQQTYDLYNVARQNRMPKGQADVLRKQTMTRSGYQRDMTKFAKTGTAQIKKTIAMGRTTKAFKPL